MGKDEKKTDIKRHRDQINVNWFEIGEING